VSTPSAESPHKLVRVYREAIEALRGHDLNRRCEAAGYAWHPESIPMPFLGRRFVFSVPAFDLLPEQADKGTSAGTADPDTLAERILVLHYLEKATGTPLSGRLVGFDQLAGGRFYGSAFRKRTEVPLAGMFAREPARLAEVAGKLGGTKGNHGDASAVIAPLPRVVMTLIVWTGDDEMPPNAKVLFDDTVEGYLTTEDIAVLGDLVIRRFKEMIGT
jgi:hypothetical protein